MISNVKRATDDEIMNEITKLNKRLIVLTEELLSRKVRTSEVAAR